METIATDNTLSTSGILLNAEGTVSQASVSAHEVVHSMVEAADQAMNKARPVIDQVAARAHQAVDKTAGAAGQTLEWLNEQGNSINGSQKKLVANTCAYVSEKPLQALGIAVASGFMLGLLIRR